MKNSQERQQNLEIPTWKEIIPDPEINSAKSAIEKLEVEGYKIGDYAKVMLTKINWKEKLKDSYEVVSVSIEELFGDTVRHTYADIKAKAGEFGLDLVPATLAPSIRLNYEKSGDWINFAMNAIQARDRSLELFTCGVGKSDSLLDSHSGSENMAWGDDTRFFFVRK